VLLPILTLAAGLVTFHGGLGMLTMSNILTGKRYDEMDGMIPYLEVIVAGPIFLVLLVILVWTSRASKATPS
jgi:hypothetical protein